MNDLTVSSIERQNVLNNRYALQSIRENLDVKGLRYYDELLFTSKMVADFYGVDERTIKRYIHEYGDELRANGYFLSQGKELKNIKIQIGNDINVPAKTTIISFFTFRAHHYMLHGKRGLSRRPQTRNHPRHRRPIHRIQRINHFDHAKCNSNNMGF